MEVLTLPRSGGKTRSLVKLMLELGNEDVVYVAPTTAQARAVGRQAALALGARLDEVPLKRFVAASAVQRGTDQRFVVDELDGVLRVLLGGEVLAAALTPSSLEEAVR